MHVFFVAVRPSELDSFGHVNNARYLEYLEWARADWLLQHGYTYDTFGERGLIPVVVEAKLRFQLEVRYGDRLRIESSPSLKHPARIIFFQEIFRGDGRRALRAEVSVVTVDANSHTLAPFPSDLLKAVET